VARLKPIVAWDSRNYQNTESTCARKECTDRKLATELVVLVSNGSNDCIGVHCYDICSRILLNLGLETSSFNNFDGMLVDKILFRYILVPFSTFRFFILLNN
jgi:hypothetical protein